jgi:hypothetical protein
VVGQRWFSVFGANRSGCARGLGNSWPGGPLQVNGTPCAQACAAAEASERARYPGEGEGVIGGEAIGKRARRGRIGRW